MLRRAAGILACALGASAFLLPPGLTPADQNDAKSLSLDADILALGKLFD